MELGKFHNIICENGPGPLKVVVLFMLRCLARVHTVRNRTDRECAHCYDSQGIRLSQQSISE